MKTSLSFQLLLWCFSAAMTLPLHAEEIIPLESSKTLQISGPKDMRTEFLAEDGVRFTYNQEEGKKGSINLLYVFPDPVTATEMKFELKQAQAERITISCKLESGKKLEQVVESLGPDWNVYAVDLAHLASKEKTDLGPIASVRVHFRTNPQAGEQTVELRKWWLE